jgi:hypothetical protein
LLIIDSSDTPGDDIDSDGSELSSASKISSNSMLAERPRNVRKHRYSSFFCLFLIN